MECAECGQNLPVFPDLHYSEAGTGIQYCAPKYDAPHCHSCAHEKLMEKAIASGKIADARLYRQQGGRHYIGWLQNRSIAEVKLSRVSRMVELEPGVSVWRQNLSFTLSDQEWAGYFDGSYVTARRKNPKSRFCR